MKMKTNGVSPLVGLLVSVVLGLIALVWRDFSGTVADLERELRDHKEQSVEDFHDLELRIQKMETGNTES